MSTLAHDRVAITRRLRGANWRAILKGLGVPESILSGRKQPCPGCGGKDRFRFTNFDGRGMYYCNQCGPGDAVDLLVMLFGWSPGDAVRALRAAIDDGVFTRGTAKKCTRVDERDERPVWSPRCRKIWSECAALVSVSPVRQYLEGRSLSVPSSASLRAHAMLDYWDVDENGMFYKAGRYPAMVGLIQDMDGDPVSLHVTWIDGGKKAQVSSPKKIISRLGDRRGCAIRIFKPDGVSVGIAEGIETAIAAKMLTGVPTWAALSCTVMEKFEPPRGIDHVVIFPDNDTAGLHAGIRLADRLHCMGICVDIQLLDKRFGDWADVAADARIRDSVDISSKIMYGRSLKEGGLQ